MLQIVSKWEFIKWYLSQELITVQIVQNNNNRLFRGERPLWVDHFVKWYATSFDLHRHFYVFFPGPPDNPTLWYRQGASGSYEQLGHNDPAYTTPGETYEFQCEAPNVFPVADSTPSFDATNLFFYYDDNFERGSYNESEPEMQSSTTSSLYNVTDLYEVVTTSADRCPLELRCVSIYDYTVPTDTEPTLTTTPSTSALLYHSSKIHLIFVLIFNHYLYRNKSTLVP